MNINILILLFLKVIIALFKRDLFLINIVVIYINYKIFLYRL